jgi:hypothetical protein
MSIPLPGIVEEDGGPTYRVDMRLNMWMSGPANAGIHSGRRISMGLGDVWLPPACVWNVGCPSLGFACRCKGLATLVGGVCVVRLMM